MNILPFKKHIWQYLTPSQIPLQGVETACFKLIKNSSLRDHSKLIHYSILAILKH